MSDALDQRRIGRFRLLRLLGEGGAAHTWLAEDTTSGEQLAVKELRLVKSSRTKQIELFERECSILKEIRHAQIPDFIDTIVERRAETLSLFLVQEFIQGPSLQQLLDAEHLFTRHDVVAIMKSCLQPLIYLHERQPQLFHRDLKPSNIIVRPSGQCVLIDFGAVREAIRDDRSNGSSVVGTFGYMAPEQFQARAYAATDLYGLAATALHLLTGIEPGRFELIRLKPDIHQYLDADPHLTAILDILLEPSPEDRYSSSRSLLKALERWEESYGEAAFAFPDESKAGATTAPLPRPSEDAERPTAPIQAPPPPSADDASEDPSEGQEEPEADEASDPQERASATIAMVGVSLRGETPGPVGAQPDQGPSDASDGDAERDRDDEDASEADATGAQAPDEREASESTPSEPETPRRTTAKQLKQRITDASKRKPRQLDRIPVDTEEAGAAECVVPGGQGASTIGAMLGVMGGLVAAIGVVGPIQYNEFVWIVVGCVVMAFGALLAVTPRKRPGNTPSEPISTADCVIDRIVKRVGPMGLGGVEWTAEYHFVADDDLHYDGQFRLPSAAAAKEVATDPARVVVRYATDDPETSTLAFRKA